ncbi:MAG: permease [Bdellovibrionota bacterium]
MLGAIEAGIGFLTQWVAVFWSTLREIAPFLVFGLVLAGVLHMLLPAKFILWVLGRSGWQGAFRGAVTGALLPFSSCGVIPIAFALRRQGASLSATTSFMTSTPGTSVEALALAAALLPAAYLGVQPLAALLLAFAAGILVEAFSANPREELRQNVLQLSKAIDNQARNEASGTCRVCGLRTNGEHQHGIGARVHGIFRYAFGTFFRDIATRLILGLAFAALLETVVPENAFRAEWLKNNAGIQTLLAIAVGIPLYSCATALTPLAAVFLAKGMDPGAALALLLAGPVANIGNIFALRRELGRRTAFVYYSGLFVFCWLLGMGFHLLWPSLMKHPSLTSVSAYGAPGWLEVSCAWLLVILTLKTWIGSARDHLHSR